MRRIRRRLEKALRSRSNKRAKSLHQNGLALSLEALERRLLLNADLPGMHLVDPQVDYFDGQTVYLDFDGEENVTYDGPVTIDGISVPAFSVASAELAGQEEAIITDVTKSLNHLFADSGVVFTAEKPDGNKPYSTAFIGGDDSVFSQYGSFQGLAEQVDVGNQDADDNAFIFSEVFTAGYADEAAVASALTGIIAHETGHLLGYAHIVESDVLIENYAAVSPDANRTFTHPAENNQQKNLTLAADTYTFRTDADPNGYHWVEWYNTYSGGGLVDQAHLYYYDDTNFSFTSGNYWVRAEIYKSNIWGDWLGWEASYRWYVTTSKPDSHVSDFDCENEPWRWGNTAQVDIDIYNEGYADADSVDIKLIASNDSTVGDSDDHTIKTWSNQDIEARTHWTKNNYTWTLPEDPYQNMPNDGTVYYFVWVETASGETDTSDNYSYDSVNMQPAEEGEIISADPDVFIGGQSKTVTVRVHNIGNGDDMLIEYDSKPPGWSISPSYRNPYMPHDSYYDALFTVTAGSSDGTIEWEFRDDDIPSNDLLDTYFQSVSVSSVNWLRWENSSGSEIPSSPPVEAGTTVYLAANATGFGTGTTFTADIFEAEVGSDPEVESNIVLSHYSGSKWRGTWVADWLDDGAASGNPEYYFDLDTYPVDPSGEIHVEDTMGTVWNSGSLTASPSGSDWYLDWPSAQDYAHPHGSGLDHYWLEVDNNIDFTNPEIDQSTGTNSYAYVTLPEDYYYWRVVAYDNEGNPSLTKNGPAFGQTVNWIRWENSSGSEIPSSPPVEAGTTVYLAANATGFGTGTTFTADIFEAEVGSDPKVESNIVLSHHSGDKWRGSWVADWLDDGALEGDPEYYFDLDTYSVDPSGEIHVRDTTAPSTVILVSPSNGAVIYEPTVDFDWSDTSEPWYGSGFDEYKLYVDDDSNFGSPVTRIPTSSYYSDLSLPEDRYWWKVRAYDNAGNYSESSPRYFDRIDPEITSMYWKKDSNTVTEIFEDDVVTLYVEAEGYDGKTIQVQLYEEDDAPDPFDDPIGSSIGISISAGIGSTPWTATRQDDGSWPWNRFYAEHIDSGFEGNRIDVLERKVNSVEWITAGTVEAGVITTLRVDAQGMNNQAVSILVREEDDFPSPFDQTVDTVSVTIDQGGGTYGTANWTSKWHSDVNLPLHTYLLFYDAPSGKSDVESSNRITVEDTLIPNIPSGLGVTKVGESWIFDWDDTKDQADPNGSGLDHYELVVANNPGFTGSKKYDTGTVSGKTVTDLDPDYYYWKVEAYDKAGNDPSVSANGPEFGSTVTDLWYENEHGDILDEDDILIVGQIVNLKVETKGLVNQSVTAQIYEDDLDWLLEDDPVGEPFSIDIGQNGIGEYEWLVPWVRDGWGGVLGDPEYYFRIDEYDMNSISIDAEGTESEKGVFFMVVPWQMERGKDMPIVLGRHSPLFDLSQPNLDYTTVTVGGMTVPLYSETGSPLGSGSHSYEFFDINKSFYEVPNDPFWYTVGYVKASDWQSKVVSDSIEVASVFKYGFDGGAFSDSSNYNVQVVDALPDWSDFGWYQGDTHWHSDITDSNYIVYGEYGTPLAIMEEIAPYLGLDWVTITDHSFDIDDYRAADTYRNISDYKSSPTLYDWENIENNPVMGFNDGIGFIKGIENSIDAPDNILPIEQYHMLTYGFNPLSDDLIVGGRGAGVDLANGALPLATLLALATPGPIDDVLAIMVDTAYSQLVLGPEFPMKTLSQTMTEVTNLSGINNLSFSYVAHPMLEDDNVFKIGFATPWSKNSVEDALGYSRNGEAVLRGFQFWNGRNDDKADESLALWEELLFDQLAGNAEVDMNHSWYISGGSDDHFSAYLKGETQTGDVQTVAWASSFNQNSILESFYNGTTIVTDGPLFAMGADSFATDLNNYGTIDVKMGQELELTSLEEGRLIFDWPNQSDCIWGNISPDDITVNHYYEGMNDPNAPKEYTLDSKEFDAYWDWFRNGKTPGWHAYRAELEIGTYKAYTNPIWMNFDAVPDPSPVVEDVTITISEGSIATDTVSATGGFGEKQLSVIDWPDYGELIFNDGSFSYSPYDENFNGTDTFTYQATDEIHLISNIGTVTIDITPVNDAPSFTPGNNVTVLEDSGLYSGVWATNLSAGPTDDESSQILTFDVSNDKPSLFAAGFQPTIDSNGTLSFRTEENAFGTASLSVILQDNGGTVNGGEDTYVLTEPFTITIDQVNDAPVVSPEPIVIPIDEDSVYSGNVTATDVDGDTLKYYADQPQHGTVLMNLDGSFTYTPNEDYFGDDNFTYWAEDDELKSNDGTIAFDIQSINDLPVAVFDYSKYDTQNGRIVIAENEVLIPDEDEFTELDLLGTDVEAPAEFLISEISTYPQKGLLERFSGNRWRYTPAENENGYDSFAYFVTDQDDGDSDPITVYLDIKPWNSKPVANSQDVVVEEDGNITITLSGSDIETPADDLVYDIVTGLGPQNGILTKISNGKYRYEPDENFFGDDSFEFTVTDDGDPAGSHSNPGDQTSLAATVSIDITPINDPPVAYNMVDGDDNDQYNTVPADDTREPAFINLAGTDVETPDMLTAEILAFPTKGELTLIEGREYKYVVDEGQTGADSFTFRLIDPEGAVSNAATVSIDIRPVNQTPVAHEQTVTVDEDDEITIMLHATDVETLVEGDLVFTPASPAHGTLILIPGSNNQYRYVPNDDFFGDDSFTFTATDDGDPAGTYGNNRPGTYDDPQTSDPVTVTIEVNPIPDPSIPEDQNVVTEVDSQYSGQVTANDVDGDILTYHVEDDAVHGEAYMNDDGSFLYTPEEGYYGEDSFTFMANDSVEEGTVVIIVGQVTIVYPKEKHSFYDADGDFVTVVFTGPAGSTMEVIKPSDSGSDIARLVLNGTDLKSSLKVTTKGKGSETTISEIVVNGSLKSLSAKTTDISDSIVLNGSISSIVLDDIDENVSVTTGSGASRGVSLRAGNLADDVVFDLAGLVKSFQVTTYAGGSLTADTIKTIKVKGGSLGADINSKGGEIQTVYAYGDILGNIEAATFIKNITSKTGGLADGATIEAQNNIQSMKFSTDIEGEIHTNGNIKSISSKLGGLTEQGMILALEDIGTVTFNKGILSGIIRGRNIKTLRALDLDNALISVADNIGTVNVRRDVIDSHVLAGYDIGMSSNRQDANDDNLSSGSIKSFRFRGSFEYSYVTTGVMTDDIYDDLYGLLPSGAEYTNGSGYGGRVSGPQPGSGDSGGKQFGFYSAGDINTKLHNQGDFVVMENL